ncbi:hypothetical protein [Mesorhizobium sp. SP-1A]|uniref:hypothetical protein n=1 Tax=Mesorhizobium sp. SP-1A TaxID=3077840 RepID=UPI0028F6D368|nr:hypothetical protein [Mesorhizobium sp. SP-1A]
MSSTYLKSSDMTAIEKILAEVRPSLVQGTHRQTVAARFLIGRFDRKAQAYMRTILNMYIKELDSHEDALARWSDEGGATGKAPRTEARRRIDNDTDGTRRRALETKLRNRLI